jgi:hypothetical protein
LVVGADHLGNGSQGIVDCFVGFIGTNVETSLKSTVSPQSKCRVR